MGSAPSSPLSPAFRDAFAAAADDSGWMSFADFMALALFHPELGYYRRPHQRIGREPGTDFYTATSLGSLFGDLIVASATSLLGADNPADYTFVEIGAEPEGGVLREVTHPFGATRTIRVGEPIGLSGPCVVFSNELFDAQPCRRFRHDPSGWQELGVGLTDQELREIPRPVPPPFDVAGIPPGYELDVPMAATALAQQIAAQPWHGLFLAIDYGRTWRELSRETPQGTVRGYYQHRQTTELLARPGEQDLTCHICWDWLAEALREHGFSDGNLQSQEQFLMQHAATLLQQTVTAEAGGLSRRKTALMHLIHPSGFGQKFQVLSARREAP